MKTSILLVGALTLLSIPSALAGKTDVYKWKDKNGVIHYSQTAPQDQEAEIITTKTPRAPLPDDGGDTVTGSESHSPTTSGNSQNLRAPQAKPPAVVQKDPATCEKAKKAADDLQKPIIMNEGKIMTIDEKNAEIQKMQEIIKIHCE